MLLNHASVYMMYAVESVSLEFLTSSCCYTFPFHLDVKLFLTKLKSIIIWSNDEIYNFFFYIFYLHKTTCGRYFFKFYYSDYCKGPILIKQEYPQFNNQFYSKYEKYLLEWNHAACETKETIISSFKIHPLIIIYRKI